MTVYQESSQEPALWTHSKSAIQYTTPSYVDTYRFLTQRSQICQPNWVRLAPNGTNLGFLQIRFSTFWRGALKCTESDLKKIPDLSHLASIWPTLGPNLVPMLQWNSWDSAWCLLTDALWPEVTGGWVTWHTYLWSLLLNETICLLYPHIVCRFAKLITIKLPPHPTSRSFVLAER